MRRPILYDTPLVFFVMSATTNPPFAQSFVVPYNGAAFAWGPA